MRPIWAEVNLDLVKHNCKEIRKFVGEGVKIMAIIKADGYGHGAIAISKEIEVLVDMFGVAILDEALSLREGGVTYPILVLGFTSLEDYPILLQQNITQTVCDFRQIEELSRVAAKLNKIAKVHIKIDTGMNRLGFRDNDKTLGIIKKILEFSNIEIEGVFSHIANGGCNDISYSYLQLDRFNKFAVKLEKILGHKIIKHLANSATIMEIKESHLDMIRPGLMLYGSFSSNNLNRRKIDLKKILTLKGIITQIKLVEIGEPISYNGTFVTKRLTKIGVLPLGYGDGFSRKLSNKAHVLIKGRKVSIIGNICMDQLILDLTDINDINVGEEVIIYGEDNPVEYFANILDTISYEIYCNINERIPRIYVRNKG